MVHRLIHFPSLTFPVPTQPGPALARVTSLDIQPCPQASAGYLKQVASGRSQACAGVHSTQAKQTLVQLPRPPRWCHPEPGQGHKPSLLTPLFPQLPPRPGEGPGPSSAPWWSWAQSQAPHHTHCPASPGLPSRNKHTPLPPHIHQSSR